MKHEWRKKEKGLYFPKTTPVRLEIPSFKFLIIEGEGTPNDPVYSESIAVLYSLANAIKMSSNNGFAPADYFEHTMYPLECVWDNSDKECLRFKVMIRQPKFVTKELVVEALERTKTKKPNDLLDEIKFTELKDDKCVQMMHLGSFDNKADSFKLIKAFCEEKELEIDMKQYREIYLTDARSVEAEDLKTVLRFNLIGA
jgi:hypothetical protein